MEYFTTIQETIMKKKLMLLAVALTALLGAFASTPASAGPSRCGWVCSAPDCCNYCCIDTPCALPICD